MESVSSRATDEMPRIAIKASRRLPANHPYIGGHGEDLHFFCLSPALVALH